MFLDLNLNLGKAKPLEYKRFQGVFYFFIFSGVLICTYYIGFSGI